MSTSLTNLHGIQLGLDKDGYLTSNVGIKAPAIFVGTSDAEVRSDLGGTVQALTGASTGTAVNTYGMTTFASSAGGNLNFTLEPSPLVGVRKTLYSLGASTSQTITAALASTASLTATVATFTGIGQALELIALSTSRWYVLSDRGGAAVA